MPTFCTVTGTVVSPDGTPIANAAVVFTSRDVRPATPLSLAPEYVTAQTDEAGALSVDIYPGRYDVRVTTTARQQYPTFKVQVPVASNAILADIQDLPAPVTPSNADLALAGAQAARDVAVGAVATIGTAVDEATGAAATATGAADVASGAASLATTKADEVTTGAVAANEAIFAVQSILQEIEQVQIAINIAIANAAASAFQPVTLSAPVGYGYTPRFTITQTGPRTYTTNINPDTYVVPAAITYYLSPTGNDANDGLTGGAPKKSIGVLVAALNASPPAGGATFVLAPGYYVGTDSMNGSSVNFSLNMICPAGRAVNISFTAGSFTKRAGFNFLYELTGSTTGSTVVDTGDVDQFGIARRLVKVGSTATSDATPRSTFFTSGSQFVHLFDNRAPSGDVFVLPSTGSRWTQTTAQNLYFKNIDFWGAQPVYLNMTTGTCTIFLDGCRELYSRDSVNGGETGTSSPAGLTLIRYNCVSAYNSFDGFGYRGSHKLIEIGCTQVYNGYSNLNDGDNGSTAHNNVTTLRINGVYRFNGDRNIHDVNTTMSWLVGCQAGDATNGSADGYESSNFAFGTPGLDTVCYAWLEGCTSLGGSGSDIAVNGGATVGAIVVANNCAGLTVRKVDATASLTVT